MKHKIKLVKRKWLNHLGLYKKSTEYKYELKRKCDYFVVLEHPKCGRTWLRFMLCQAISAYFSIPLDNVIFDVVYQEVNLPLVYYVHGFNPVDRLENFHFQKIFDEKHCPAGIILLTRQPERVMLSYYYQLLYRQKNKAGFKNLGDMIKNPDYGIAKYVEYINFYMKNINKEQSLIIRYEDLRADTFNVLSNILKFINIKLEHTEIKSIIASSSFKYMKRVEANKTFNVGWLLPANSKEPNSFKVRSCGQEKLDQIFSKKELDYMYNIYSQSIYFQELGYCHQAGM